MDRLSALIIGLVAVAAACDKGKDEPPASRVDNAKVGSKQIATVEAFCDYLAKDDASGPALVWPQLAPGQSAPAPAKGWRWLNVWATWCKPCVEELPLLARSFAEWKKAGQAVGLTLLSVDADASAAQSFIAARAGLPSTLQLKEAGKASEWLTSVGLASGSAIPVHMVLDAQDKLLCARSGGISQGDLERFHRALFPCGGRGAPGAGVRA
jgi:thiol-disulfide isomerase/thioredoxin